MRRQRWQPRVMPSITALARQTNSLKDFENNLLSISSLEWASFIQQIPLAQMKTIFFSSGTGSSDAFLSILNKLPIISYSTFFSAMHPVILEVLSALDFGLLLDKCRSQGQEISFLILAMHGNLDLVLRDGNSVGCFLLMLDSRHWPRVFALLGFKIKEVCASRKSFIHAIDFLLVEDFPILFELLGDVAKAHIKSADDVVECVSILPPETRLRFLAFVWHDNKSLELTHYQLTKVLPLLQFHQWWALLDILDDDYISLLFPEAKHLGAFLEILPEGYREPFIDALWGFLPTIVKTPEELHALVSLYPQCEPSIFASMENGLFDLISVAVIDYFEKTSEELLGRASSAKQILDGLIRKSLPLLMAKESLLVECPALNNSTHRVAVALADIDQQDGHLLHASVRKFEILYLYIEDVMARRIPPDDFYFELVSYFGAQFFSVLQAYFERSPDFQMLLAKPSNVNWISRAAVEVHRLKAQPCVWPEEMSEAQQKQFQAYNDSDLNELMSLLALPLPVAELKSRLRQFFAMRSVVTVNENDDYMLNPFLPANQACRLVAQSFKHEDESVGLMLMPWIQRVEGYFPSDDIMGATEGTGEFLPHEFLPGVDGESLLFIPGILESALQNTGRFFPEKTQAASVESEAVSVSEEGQLFRLTAEDRHRISVVVGDTSQAYLNKLKQLHLKRHGKKPTLGSALEELADAVENSDKENAGSDLFAAMCECAQPAADFHKIWFSLPLLVREQVKDFKAKGSTDTLEEFLIFIFVSAMREGISDQELEHFSGKKPEEMIFHCTNQIGIQLKSLINDNAEALFNIPLFEEATDVVAQSDSDSTDTAASAQLTTDNTSLNELAVQFENELPDRKPMMGTSDKDCKKMRVFFHTLMKYHFDPEKQLIAYEALAAQIHSARDCVSALLLIPTSHWEKFLFEGKIRLFKHFLNPTFTAPPVLSEVLSYLPMSLWQHFCRLFYAKLPYLLDGVDFGRVLSRLSEERWPNFIAALGDDFIDGKMDVHFVAMALIVTPLESWEKILGVLGKERLKKYIHHAVFIQFLSYFRTPYHLFVALHGFHEVLGDDEFLECFSCREVIIMLHQLDASEWRGFFNVLGEALLKRLIPTPYALNDFLALCKKNQLNALVCLDAMDAHLPAIIGINPAALNFLINVDPIRRAVLLPALVLDLPKMIDHYLIVLSAYSADEQEDDGCVRVQSNLDQLLPLALPVMLSPMVIGDVWMSIYPTQRLFAIPDSERNLYQQLVEIEHQEINTADLYRISLRKFQVLHRYIQDEPREIRLFSNALVSRLGREFIDNLHNYLTKNHLYPEVAATTVEQHQLVA